MPKKSNYHICFVSPNAYPVLSDTDHGMCGGAEVQQFLIAMALVKRGYGVTFVVDDFGQSKRENHHGVDVIKGPFRYLGGSKIYFFADTLKLISLLRKIAADFNLLKTPTSLLFAMGLHRKLFGGKLIKLVSHDRDCNKSRYDLTSKLYYLGNRVVDYTVFQYNNQKILGEKYLGLRGRVIRNIAHVSCNGNQKADKDIDVLWVGSCFRRKQPELLLDLAEKLPQVGFTIIMSKGSDKDYQHQIMERANVLENVDYRGFVRYSQIGRFYQRSKILICTSCAEGFPNVFLQAWQQLTPVITLSIDPDNIIEKHQIGIVSGNLEKMRLDILELLQNEELRRRLGENGKDYVSKYHSVESIAQQYVELFESI
jgi:glycosyltransferase involved in cell wall biosynthesis